MANRYDAVKAENLDKTSALLAAGGNPNAPVGKKGMTALERAAATENFELKRQLGASGHNLVASDPLAILALDSDSQTTLGQILSALDRLDGVENFPVSVRT